MNNPPINTLFALPDPNAAPLNFTQQVQILNTLVQSSMGGGDYLPYVVSHSTPGVDDRGRVWIELDTAGRPISTKIWVATAGGAWRRIYNGMLKEIRMYSGDPTVDFDVNGLGLISKTYDGWALCNGKNGTTDLSDKFIVAGHLNNADGKVGYDNGWQANLTEDKMEKTGGASEFTLDKDHTWRDELISGDWSGENLNREGNIQLYGIPSKGDPDKNTTIVEGNTDPDPIPTVPPFIALGFIQFVGYLT